MPRPAQCFPSVRVTTLSLVCAAALAGRPTPLRAQGSAEAQPAVSAELARVRTSLEKYRDPIVAIHDGYLSTLACVEYKEGGEGHMHFPAGGMGVHFLNFGLVGRPLDPTKPQVLIYEPVGDRLQLAAAEWFVPAAAAGGKAPAIFGQPLMGPMEGHTPFQPKGLSHYDLHVWLWRTNPAGTFAPTNPAITCPRGAYAFKQEVPKALPRRGE